MLAILYPHRPKLPYCSSGFTYSLAQRPTLAHSHLITFLHTESGTDVRGQVLMSLLISGVLWDEVEVFAADDESAVHFGADNGTSEDTAADGDHASEGTFLVCLRNDVR